MDNVSLYGFRFVKTLLGKNTPNFRDRWVASAYGAAPGGTDVDLNKGDPIKVLNTGYVDLCVANEPVHGIVQGFQYWDGKKMVYSDKLPHGSGVYGTNYERATVCTYIPVAGAVFEVDCDDNVTATTQAAYHALIEENCDHSINADADSAEARPLLDINTHATATFQWRIIGISKTFQNRDFSGARVKLYVVANESSDKFGNDPSADGI